MPALNGFKLQKALVNEDPRKSENGQPKFKWETHKKLPCNVSNLDFEIKFKLFVTIHPRFILNLKYGDNQTVTLKSKENNFFVQAKLDQGLISESKYVTTKQGTYK